MPGTAVVQSGNYTLEIDAGFNIDGIVLDDPVKGILAGYTTTTTRTNLFPDPSIENASTGTYWVAPKITESRSSDYAYSGTYSLKGVIDDGTSGQYFQVPQTVSGMLDVVAGQTYTFSAYVYLPSTNSANSTWRADLYFWNGTTYTGANSGSTVTITRGNWTRLTTTATVPSGYYKALPRIIKPVPALAVGQIAYVDAWLLETGSSLLPYFDGTYADTYTGYTLTSQTWNGATNASTSTATWGLNSSYIGSNYVLDGTTQFADVTDGTLNIAVRRGRRDQGDQFSAGTMAFTLNDTLAGGVFNPFDTSSPYYDANADVPGLAPMRRVNLIRYDLNGDPEYLFKGYVVNYDYNFALGGVNTVSVYCADQFYLLSQTYMDTLNVTPETSGERIETVLDLPEVDFPTGPTARNIATGTVNLGHDSAYTVPAGTNVLAYLTQINDTAEFGRLFMSRDGVLTFQERIGNTLSASVADFHDDGTNIKYDRVGITFEADSVVNRAVVANLDGSTAVDSDAGSIAIYFIQTESITNSLLESAGTQLTDAAAYLLQPTPEARYTDVSTPFASLTTAQRDTVAIVDIGDTITIEKTFPAGTGTTQLAQELSVEGVEHFIEFATGHRITFYTAPTTIVYELILDDATYGVLDAENVLG